MDSTDGLHMRSVPDLNEKVYSFDSPWLTTYNPLYWIGMYYYLAVKWIYVDNFNFVCYFCTTCSVLTMSIRLLRKLGIYTWVYRPQKVGNRKNLELNQRMKDVKEEGLAKNNGDAQSSKPKSKKAARVQKKEQLKARLRKGTPQPGPSGVLVSDEMEPEPGPSTSRCEDIGCACESCINEVE